MNKNIIEPYVKTEWIDNQTLVSAMLLNKIEDQLLNSSNELISSSDKIKIIQDKIVELEGSTCNCDPDLPTIVNSNTLEIKDVKQAIDNVYTKQETDLAISTAISNANIDIDLTAYSTTEEMNAAINEATFNKVEKINGKGLSSNDFTDELKIKLEQTDNFVKDWGNFDNGIEVKIRTMDNSNLKAGKYKYLGSCTGSTKYTSSKYVIKSINEVTGFKVSRISSNTYGLFVNFKQSSNTFTINDGEEIETNAEAHLLISATTYEPEYTDVKLGLLSDMNYIGNVGEIVVNSDTSSLHVMDGINIGGHALAKQSDVYTKEEVDSLIANTSPVSYSKDITDTEWSLNSTTGLYSITITHNKQIPIDSIITSFYHSDEAIILDYKIIDENNIEIYSDEAIEVKLVLNSIGANGVATELVNLKNENNILKDVLRSFISQSKLETKTELLKKLT